MAVAQVPISRRVRRTKDDVDGPDDAAVEAWGRMSVTDLSEAQAVSSLAEWAEPVIERLRTHRQRANGSGMRSTGTRVAAGMTAAARNCPETATKVPAGGHENCPLAAMRSARHVVVCLAASRG